MLYNYFFIIWKQMEFYQPQFFENLDTKSSFIEE